MTPEQLVEEAQNLARPCVNLSLVSNDSAPVAWIRAKSPGQSLFDWIYGQRGSASSLATDLLMYFERDVGQYGEFQVQYNSNS